MPVYQYQVINGKETPEIIEIEESSDSKPITSPPLTGEPIKRIISAPGLALKHSSQIEKKSLSRENLEKHGFTRYEKDHSEKAYNRTAGKGGPSFLKP